MRKLFTIGLLTFIFACSSDAVMGPPHTASSEEEETKGVWTGEIQVEDPTSLFATYINPTTTVATTTTDETVPVREYQLGSIEAQKGDLILNIAEIKTITIELDTVAYPVGSLGYTLPKVVDPAFVVETLNATGGIIKLTVDVAGIVNSGNLRFQAFGSKILDLKIKTTNLPALPVPYTLVL